MMITTLTFWLCVGLAVRVVLDVRQKKRDYETIASLRAALRERDAAERNPTQQAWLAGYSLGWQDGWESGESFETERRNQAARRSVN